MSAITVLTLVGSLRAASVNRQIAGLAATTAPAGITVNLYRGLGGGLGELPLYNEDIDNAVDLPASARALRGAVANADAILVGHTGIQRQHSRRTQERDRLAVTPLRAHNALSAKPLAVVGASMGQYGGVWGPR
jgi:NAD(P)H-dependent FMN reductase